MRPTDPRLRPLLGAARGSLTVLVVVQVLVGLLTVAQAFAVGTLVVQAVSGGPWQRAAAATVGLVVARALLGWLTDALAARASTTVAAEVRRRVLTAAATPQARPSELTLLATRGAAAIEPYLTRYLPALVVGAVLPVATLAAITWQDLWSGLIVLLTLPLVPIFAILIGLATKDRAEKQWRTLELLAGHFSDVVRGLPTLVAHRRGTAQVATIARISDRYRRNTNETLKLAFSSSGVLELVATLSVALVAVCVGLRLAAGSLDFGTAMIVLLLAPEAYWPLRRMGAEFHAAAEGTAALVAVADLPSATAGSRAVPADGELRVHEAVVRFGDVETLAPITATFGPGLTAITGPSGCGKSTLLNVLRGEQPPTTGTVSYAGIDTAEFDPAAWQSKLSVVPQQPWLRAGTVADNLRLGVALGAAQPSTEALLDALRAVDLSLALTDRLGEDGVGLSAGQTARLALARVLVADRPIVILDEPTAHVDADTERLLLRVLTELARDRIVITVAHRDAVVAVADRVLALTPPAPAAQPEAPILVPTPTPSATEVTPRSPQRSPETTPNAETTVPSQARPRIGLAGATALGVASTACGVALTATAAWLLTTAAAEPPVLTLMVAIVAVRTFGLGRPVFRYVERLASHDIALRELATRRAEVYADLVPLVPGRVSGRGDALAAIVDDVEAGADRTLRVRMPLWSAATVGTLTTLLLLPLSATGATVAASLCLLTGLAAGWSYLVAGAAERSFVEQRHTLAQVVTSEVSDAPRLRAWQHLATGQQAVAEAGAALGETAASAARQISAARAAVTAGCGLGTVAMALLLAGQVSIEVSAPVAALLILLPLALGEALAPAVDAAALAARTQAAEARLTAIRVLPPAVVDPTDPAAPSGGWELLADRLTLTRGSLAPLDLELRPGQRLGVVGPSGVGKSTLAATLVRFLDPTAGGLSLGGVPLSHLALSEVRGNIGWVDDNPYIFASSLVENVRLARPSATDAEVAAALTAVRLGGWAAALPEGLATHLGEGGIAVSGGERARIGLARAVLAAPPVLVLDEPTAHLDSATAHAVTQDLLALPAALIWITHSTVGLDRMDRVLDVGPDRVPVG